MLLFLSKNIDKLKLDYYYWRSLIVFFYNVHIVIHNADCLDSRYYKPPLISASCTKTQAISKITQ